MVTVNENSNMPEGEEQIQMNTLTEKRDTKFTTPNPQCVKQTLVLTPKPTHKRILVSFTSSLNVLISQSIAILSKPIQQFAPPTVVGSRPISTLITL